MFQGHINWKKGRRALNANLMYPARVYLKKMFTCW